MVRQWWEMSSDGRATWTVLFDGLYTRKQSRPVSSGGGSSPFRRERCKQRPGDDMPPLESLEPEPKSGRPEPGGFRLNLILADVLVTVAHHNGDLGRLQPIMILSQIQVRRDATSPQDKPGRAH